MRELHRNFEASDLKDDDTKLQILRNTNADVLVLSVQTSDGEASAQMNLETWAPASPTNDQHINVDYPHSVHHTLSDLAFAGKSFELRRWSGDQLLLTGFRDDVPDRKDLLGLGDHFERLQAGYVRDDLPHPLSSSECPYRFEVRVDGKVRPFIPVDGKYYVMLNAGDKPEIVFHNKCQRDVLVGLYIDGENTCEEAAPTPSRTPSHRHWIVARPESELFGSWSISRQEQKRVRSIVSRSWEPGSTGETAVGDPSGTITALVLHRRDTGDRRASTPAFVE